MTGRQAFPLLLAAGLIAVLALTGCSSAALSGLDATNEFACAAPEGVPCVSMTGVYSNAKTGNLPGLKVDPTKPQFKSSPDKATPEAAPYLDRGAQASVDYTTPSPLPTAQAAAPQNQFRASPAWMNAPTTGTPLRSPERILRLWIRPFEDADGDLHDQRYVYLTVNRGVWAIDAANDAIKNQYRTVRLMTKPDAGAERSDSSSVSDGLRPPSRTTLPIAGPSGPSQ